jgi:hypothetical protein
VSDGEYDQPIYDQQVNRVTSRFMTNNGERELHKAQWTALRPKRGETSARSYKTLDLRVSTQHLPSNGTALKRSRAEWQCVKSTKLAVLCRSVTRSSHYVQAFKISRLAEIMLIIHMSAHADLRS